MKNCIIIPEQLFLKISIYRYKESLPENHQFIKENHKETLAQVFTEVRYKKSDNECMSVTLKETLKKQGFEK